MRKIERETEVNAAYIYALSLLKKQAYFSVSLRDKLVKKYSKSATNSVLRRLKKNRFLNDEDYLFDYFESRLKKGYSARKTAAELTARFNVEIPEKISKKYDEKDGEVALNAAAKYLEKHPNEDKETRRRKLYNLLTSRGFSYAVIGAVFAAYRLGEINGE